MSEDFVTLLATIKKKKILFLINVLDVDNK